MKNRSFLGVVIASFALCFVPLLPAEEVTATVYVNGYIANWPTRQTVYGAFYGVGEYGPFDLDVALSGTVRSQVNTRVAEPTVLGRYPVKVDLRVRKWGRSLSKSFGTNVFVGIRNISISRVGGITLAVPIQPRRAGLQRFRGYGVLRYNF